MLKNGFQLTMGVYRVITFLFPLIRVKLSVDFEFSYDQLDPVSLNSALWPDSITPSIFFSHEADCTLHGHRGQKEQQ